MMHQEKQRKKISLAENKRIMPARVQTQAAILSAKRASGCFSTIFFIGAGNRKKFKPSDWEESISVFGPARSKL